MVESYLISYVRPVPNPIFQQDNARLHVIKFIMGGGIQTLQHLPQKLAAFEWALGGMKWDTSREYQPLTN